MKKQSANYVRMLTEVICNNTLGKGMNPLMSFIRVISEIIWFVLIWFLCVMIYQTLWVI